MPDFSKANDTLTVTTDVMTWLSVHGNVLLALRHPSNTGPSGQLASNFAMVIGEMLVRCGLLTQAELDEIHDNERKYGRSRAQ